MTKSTTVHFGVTVPQIKRTWAEARDAATTFERLGYDSVWVCDHLYGVPSPTLPILEAWSELAAIAAVTTRVEFGTLVTPPFFRNTGVFAKQVATIDNIAGGRTICGLGAGWYDEEFRAYGLDFPSTSGRLKALEEMCVVLRRMWREESVSFHGDYVHVEKVMCEPKPVRAPRMLIGGGGERVLLKIAARHADIWNNMGVAQAQFEKKLDILHRHCDAIGRDPRAIVASQQCLVVIAETEGETKAAKEKAVRIYGGHLGAGLEDDGLCGTPSQVIDRIGKWLEKGCSMFVIEFFGRDTRVPARLFAESVIPAFRS